MVQMLCTMPYDHGAVKTTTADSRYPAAYESLGSLILCYKLLYKSPEED